jgi:hypothetical protein
MRISKLAFAKQVVSYLSYSGQGVNAFGRASPDPGCVKTLRGTTAPAILRLVVTLSAKKTQKFVFRSAI